MADSFKSEWNFADEFSTEIVEKHKAKEVLVLERELYNDVFNHQDNLLEEAKNIIDGEIDEAFRIKRLNDLGFSNSESIKAKIEWATQRLQMKRDAEFATYYKTEYPTYRFISYSKVEQICAKYGLVYSNVYNYISDIPEKNQKEILNFKVKRKDLEENYTIPSSAIIFIEEIPGIEASKYSPVCYPRIMAPPSKFKQGLRLQGFELIKDDPIVLQPVKGGYLIVTAWGLEAADENVVNEINN